MNTDIKGSLPDFLIIGAMKAGTTSLHSYLGKHPEIHTSELKEINFFSSEDKYIKGIHWYKKHFITDKRIKGESSQGYSRAHMTKNVPEKIHETIPNVKLIYILRDPVERIISHYYETVSQDTYILKNFVSAIIKNPNNNWVKTSSYYWQLEKYLLFFKRDQFLFITSEELKKSKLNTLNKVFTFLGVEEINDESIFDFERNTRSEKKKYLPIVKKIGQSKLGTLIPISIKRKMKHNWLAQKFGKKKINKIPFSENDKSKLRDILSPDVEKLKKYTGNDFSDWSF